MMWVVGLFASHSLPKLNFGLNPNTRLQLGAELSFYALSSTNKTAYKYAENQRDSINFGFGTSGTGITPTNNYVTGGHSNSGCGIIADEAANSAQFTYNQMVNAGQCGIGSGTNQLVDHNKVFETESNKWRRKHGHIRVETILDSEPCGPVTVSNNIAVFRNPDGRYNSYWNGGGCGTPTLTGDTGDLAAFNTLNPPSTTMPPPLMPPHPKNCVAKSPYSTQTGGAVCQ